MKREFGFTLVELSVVLAILGLIFVTFLPFASTQVEFNQRTQAKNELLEIKESLIGYAEINGFLPCPDKNGDGQSDPCPNQNATAATEGNVPWGTLGGVAKDPWGGIYQYRVNNRYSVAFLLNTQGSSAGIIKICADINCQKTEASNVPFVLYSKGKNGGNVPSPASDEAENLDLDGIFVFHAPVQSGFDDILVWESNNVLMNRMITVGKLP